MNRIWNISVETFTLCSGMFFLDGIKRDRWIWSGDGPSVNVLIKE
jgi:alpha-L-rhamnosidase